MNCIRLHSSKMQRTGSRSNLLHENFSSGGMNFIPISHIVTYAIFAKGESNVYVWKAEQSLGDGNFLKHFLCCISKYHFKRFFYDYTFYLLQ